MAAANAMKTMFGRLGFLAPGPEMLVVDQGIDRIDELSDLDDAEVETLLKLLRRPGGTIVNPNAAAAGQPAHVTAPGIAVSMRAATHLKLAVYYCRHQKRTSRPLRTTDITCPKIKALKNLRDEEENATDPDEAPKIDVKNWLKTLEALQEWISLHPGIKCAPLSYVIRAEINPAPHASDPAYLEANSLYSSYQEEITARSPIQTTGVLTTYAADYAVDNKAVWELISRVCRDEDCWTHVKPYSRKKDGRNAFLALWTYYLGKQNVDNQATTSEKGLELATWSQNTKRYNFDDYVKIHLDHHQILSDLTAHGYAGIDDRSKVRHLLKGIKSLKMDSVKTAILASSTLRSDFNGCVTLYKDFMVQNEGITGGDGRNISAFNEEGGGGGGGGRGRGRGGGRGRGRGGGKRKREQNSNTDGKCEDRYYSSDEYSNLSKANRAYLRKLRDDRVSSGKDRNVGTKKSKITEAISVLSTAVDQLQVANSKTVRIAEVATTTPTTTLTVLPPAVELTNTNNSALSRISTRQGHKV